MSALFSSLSLQPSTGKAFDTIYLICKYIYTNIIIHMQAFINNVSVQLSCSVMFEFLQPHGLKPSRLSCPSPTPGACTSSCPLSQWCHPTISYIVIPFSSFLQSFPASGSFLMSQLFTSSGQSIGTSVWASVLPVNIHNWFPLGLTFLISLQSKGLSRVLQHHSSKVSLLPRSSAFFMVQLSHPYMLLEKP